MSGSAQGGCSQVACCGWQFLNRECKERADCLCRASRVRAPLASDGLAGAINVTRHGGRGSGAEFCRVEGLGFTQN